MTDLPPADVAEARKGVSANPPSAPVAEARVDAAASPLVPSVEVMSWALIALDPVIPQPRHKVGAQKPSSR